MRAKFFNKKVKTSFGIFDSTSEYKRFLYLKDMEQKGEISNLQRQVTFTIIPNQYMDKEIKLKTKTKIVSRVVEREVTYTCDFLYEKDGETIVEDVKSDYTRKDREYILKRKLMLYLKGIRLNEVVMK